MEQRVVSAGWATPQVPAKPISIGDGETAQLVHFARNVHFEGGPEKQSPVYRIVVELKARCLRPPGPGGRRGGKE